MVWVGTKEQAPEPAPGLYHTVVVSKRRSTIGTGTRRRFHRRSPTSTTLSGFADLVEIGRGGCCVVYRAREVDTGRQVALKVIDVAGVSGANLASFERETLALGALGAHPHIVTLYRSIGFGERRAALVLELCAGSLGQRLERDGPMAARRAAATGVKVAGALETAHRAGLLHLDVKPSNILITQYGEPALADFGMALLRTPAADPRALVGFTSAHVAPEMLAGGAATPATDVYQLASTLYHLLTGRSPFRAFDGEHQASIAHRVLYQQVEPITDPNIPRALSDLIIWAMAKDPASRPATAATFADALRAVELSCRWTPTAAAVPGGQLPLLTHEKLRPGAGESGHLTLVSPAASFPVRQPGRPPTYFATGPSTARSSTRQADSQTPPGTMPSGPLDPTRPGGDRPIQNQPPTVAAPGMLVPPAAPAVAPATTVEAAASPPGSTSNPTPPPSDQPWSDPYPTVVRQSRRSATGLDAIAPRRKRTSRFVEQDRPPTS